MAIITITIPDEQVQRIRDIIGTNVKDQLIIVIKNYIRNEEIQKAIKGLEQSNRDVLNQITEVDIT